MTPEEWRRRIKQAHAKTRPALPSADSPKLAPKQVAEILARVEAAEIAHGKAVYARRLADMEAHRRLVPPGSIPWTPRKSRQAPLP
jgi:hypothetical protein